MTDELSTALNPSSPMDDEKEKSAKTITTVVYVLQAVSFFVGITFLAAVIVNYMKISDVRETRSESHFRWQIRTFWFGLLWSVIGIILMFVIVGYFIFIVNVIWIMYRVIKGWLRLADGKEMYVEV